MRWGAVGLCFPLGAGIAFLTLEFAGMPVVPLALVLLLLLMRPFRFPAMLIAFGAGFSSLVTYFLVTTSGVLTGDAGTSGAALFLGCLVLGLTIAGIGVAMLARGAHPG